jgi:hypothetical protein
MGERVRRLQEERGDTRFLARKIIAGGFVANTSEFKSDSYTLTNPLALLELRS